MPYTVYTLSENQPLTYDSPTLVGAEGHTLTPPFSPSFPDDQTAQWIANKLGVEARYQTADDNGLQSIGAWSTGSRWYGVIPAGTTLNHPADRGPHNPPVTLPRDMLFELGPMGLPFTVNRDSIALKSIGGGLYNQALYASGMRTW